MVTPNQAEAKRYADICAQVDKSLCAGCFNIGASIVPDKYVLKIVGEYSESWNIDIDSINLTDLDGCDYTARTLFFSPRTED